MPEYVLTAPTAEPIDQLEALDHMRVSSADSQALRLSLCIAQGRAAAEMKTRQQCLHARFVMVLDRFPQAGYGTPLPFAHPVNIPGYAVMLPRAPAVAVVSIRFLDMTGAWLTMDPATYVTNLTMQPGIVTPAFGCVWPITLPQIGSVQITYDAGYASPFTRSASTIIVSGPVQWVIGNKVRFSNSGGALPAPLKPMTDYLMASAAAGVYTLTDVVGNPITLTDAGSGTNYVGDGRGSRYIGEVPSGMRGWILIRAASLYVNREEVAILNRGHIEELPFMEGLLDEFRVSLP